MLQTFIFHVSFAALAATLAVTLPELTVVSRTAAVLAGGLLFVLLALGHEVWRRHDGERHLDRRIGRLRRAADGEIGELREDMATLRRRVDELEALAARPPGHDATLEDVRLLQSLVEQLSGHLVPRAPRAAESAKTSVRPPAPAMLDEVEVLDYIRDALSAGRIDMHQQPIVSLPQRKLRYYEVFSRIRAGEQGDYLPPEQYIRVAEREGLISAIDNMLLYRCIQLVRETERRNHSIGFFVNISAHTLTDAPFMRQFAQFMAQNRELAPRLVFELSQADLRSGGPMGGQVLTVLGEAGFRFSMDQVTRFDLDPAELQRLNVRFVKVEAGRMLEELAGGPSQFLVERLKERLDRLSIDLIVEKVETEAQLVELLDLGLDFGQGFLFGEPRPGRRVA